MRERADIVEQFERLLRERFKRKALRPELDERVIDQAWNEAGGDTTEASRTLYREVYGKDHVVIADVTDPVPVPGKVLPSVAVYMLDKTVRLMDIRVWEVYNDSGDNGSMVVAHCHYDKNPENMEKRLAELGAFNRTRVCLLTVDGPVPPDMQTYDLMQNAPVKFLDGSRCKMDVRVVYARGHGEERVVLAEHCACHQCHSRGWCDDCGGCLSGGAACDYSCRCHMGT